MPSFNTFIICNSFLRKIINLVEVHKVILRLWAFFVRIRCGCKSCCCGLALWQMWRKNMKKTFSLMRPNTSVIASFSVQHGYVSTSASLSLFSWALHLYLSAARKYMTPSFPLKSSIQLPGRPFTTTPSYNCHSKVIKLLCVWIFPNTVSNWFLLAIFFVQHGFFGKPGFCSLSANPLHKAGWYCFQFFLQW